MVWDVGSVKTRVVVFSLWALITLSGVAISGVAMSSDFLQNKGFEAFLDEAVDKEGFDRLALIELFSEVKQQDKILELMAKPAEKTKIWGEYGPIFVNDLSTERGLAFWSAHEKTIASAAKKYQVPPEIIVSIIGVETRYGRIKGGYRVIEALSTLGFSYPPRSEFFRKELMHFLLLGREQGVDVLGAKGSYAGAMGYPQFIPSSYRKYAVDFDGDSKVDLIGSPEDAIGSVANYFHRHGWQVGKAVARPLTYKAGAVPEAIGNKANTSLAPELNVKQIRDYGFSGAETLPSQTPAALFKFSSADGDQYWAGFENFYVITQYNHSRLYAMAVYQLAESLRQAKTGKGRS